ncbi:MAG: deoxyribonuclease IV [Armatimonadota bacterium]
MPLLGAHIPTKGDPPSALEVAHRLGCDIAQIFVKPPIQWMAAPITDATIVAFRNAQHQAKMKMVIAHAGYLVNLASTRPDVLIQSRKAILDEMQRCHLLGIPYLVMHTGAHLGIGEKRGVQRLRESLHWLLDKLPLIHPVSLLLENTAGQGTCLGYTLEQLAEIVEGLPKEKVGICLDTCHLFVAGYELRTNESVKELARLIETTVGWERVKLLHANDSLHPLGSRIDRHWHIGKGHIGLEGFRQLLSHSKFSQLPIVIETPEPELYHAENLNQLRTILEAA